MSLEPRRPNPEQLLVQAKKEQKQQRRGKLKIFIGYAPGVGKTFTMLEAAQARKKDTDVVVAIAETHGRTETANLLKGLEVIPRKEEDYRDIKLLEMDLDGVIARHPQLALVDELAHENTPGSRHAKRYQDVGELLDAGIDVFTTLNIQHIESGRNIIAQITGVWVRETVPDSFVDQASEIELVDLPPDELLTRLKKGKVYVPEQIARATEQFFRKGNLTALRELTMRTAAKHVDEQTLAYMKAHDIAGPWPSGERLLLYIGPDSMGSRLVRSARRLAYDLGAEWTAVNVETTGDAKSTQEEKNQIADSLRLAEKLKAKVVTLRADSIVRAVVDYAQANNFTKIIVVKPSNKPFPRFLGESTVSQIVRFSPVDVEMVNTGGELLKPEKRPGKSLIADWRGVLLGTGLVALATLLGKLAPDFFSPVNLIMVYLLCVLITSYYWGFRPSIFVSILSVLVFDFVFIPPQLTFAVSDTKYLFTFLVLLGVGIVLSTLMTKVRQQTEAASLRERQTAALYALGRDLALSNNLESYVASVEQRAKETFGHDAEVFLPDPDNEESVKLYRSDAGAKVDENELAAATWAFKRQTIVGRGTDTLPSAKARYIPMSTARGAVGVLAILLPESGAPLTLEQENLLKDYANLGAIAIESILVNAAAQKAQVLQTTERLQTALLNAVSHDLRTPLVSIIGALSSLQEEGMSLDDSSKRKLIDVAREEADRLNHLITNLLDVSRVESGAIRISKEPSDVHDLIGAALEQLGSRTDGHPITIDVPSQLPCVSVDFGLIVQTIGNILDNAIKYSPVGSPIEIKGQRAGNEVIIEIADRGIGIQQQDLSRVFDKFYRVQNTANVAGTGLGLFICKGIVEAHGGRIFAETRAGGGTIMKVVLPVEINSIPEENLDA